MAQRLNKKLVVGLTIAGMALIAGAGIFIISVLPGKDPKPSADNAEKAVKEAKALEAKAIELDAAKDLLGAADYRKKAGGSYQEASKYYMQAWKRAQKKENRDSKESNHYLVLAGDMLLQSGEIGASLDVWRKVLLNDAKNEEAQQRIVTTLAEEADLGSVPWQVIRKDAENLCEITQNNNATGLYALGRARADAPNASTEDFSKSEELLQKAFDREPTNPRFAEALAIHQIRRLEQQIGESRRKGEDVSKLEAQRDPVVDKAVQLFDRVTAELAKSPTQNTSALTLAWRKRGQFHQIIMQLSQAELAQKEAQRTTPTERERLRNKAEKHSKEALRCLEEAVKLSPDDSETLVSMGVYWGSRQSSAADAAEKKAELDGYTAKAKGFFEQAIKADPDGFEAYIRLKDIYMQASETAFSQKQRDAGRENYRKADQVLSERLARPSGTGLKLWRNKSYMSLTRWQLFQINSLQVERVRGTADNQAAAEADVKPLIDRLVVVSKDYAADSERGEKDQRALFMKARIEILEGKRFEALKTLRELEPLLDPGELWMMSKMFLADLCLQLDQPGTASDVLQSVVSAYPNLDSAWAMLARSLAAQPNKEKETEVAARRALELSPQNREALIALATVYEKTRNYQGLEDIRKQLGAQQTESQSKILEASLLLSRAKDPENKDPELMSRAQAMLRGILDGDPLNIQALRTLLSTYAPDGPTKKMSEEHRKEIDTRIAKARAALEARQKNASATRPADEAKADEALKTNLAFLSIMTDPNTTEEDRVKKTETLIRQGTDPFLVEVDLYRLYMGLPDKEDEALTHLKKAYELKPGDAGVVEMLFRISLKRKDWDTATKLVDRAVEVGIDRSGGQYYRGQLLFAQEKYAEAEKAFREGLKSFPDHSAGHAWLARTLLALQRMDEAEQEFVAAFGQNPRNGLAALGLARLADMKGDIEKKKKYLSACAALGIQDEWVVQQSQFVRDQENPEEGITRREELRKKDPNDWANLMALSDLYIKTGKTEKVQELFAEAYKLQPTNLRVVQTYAQHLRSLKPPDFKAAEEIIRKAIEGLSAPDKKKDKAAAELLLAAHLEVLLLRGVPGAPTPEAVDAAYLKAAETYEGGNVLMDIAAHYKRARNDAKLEEILRKAVALAQRDNEPELEKAARQQVIDLLLTSQDAGRTPDLLKEIEAFRARFDDPVGLLAMSQFCSFTGREPKALEYATQFIAASADKSLGYFERGRINYRRGDIELAMKDFREAKAVRPDGFDYQHRVLLARCLEATGQTDQAIVELNSILQSNPNLGNVSEELYRLYMRNKQYEQAEAMLMPHYQANPKDPSWIALLMEVAVARGDQTRAIERGIETLQAANYSPLGLSTLLTAYLRFQRYDDLVTFVNTRLPEEHRNKPMVWIGLTGAYAGKGDLDKTAEMYNRILDAKPDTGIAASAGVAIIDRLGLDKGLPILQKRASDRPEDALSQMVYLMMLRNKSEDEFIKQANAMLTKLGTDEKIKPVRIELLQTLAAVHYTRKDLQDCRKRYEELIALTPPNSAASAIAMNNLAFLLMEDMKDPASAIKYARQAEKIMPGQPNVLDTAGWNLILTGDFDRGIAKVRQAIGVSALTDPTALASIHYHAAIGLMRRGQELARQNKPSESEQDMAEAKTACRQAHQLLFMVKRDPDKLLPKLLELGKQLGLELDPNLPAENKAAAKS